MNTVILFWNPDISSIKYDDFRMAIQNIGTETFNWSVCSPILIGLADIRDESCPTCIRSTAFGRVSSKRISICLSLRRILTARLSD